MILFLLEPTFIGCLPIMHFNVNCKVHYTVMKVAIAFMLSINAFCLHLMFVIELWKTRHCSDGKQLQRLVIICLMVSCSEKIMLEFFLLQQKRIFFIAI